jgi:twitching motility two-component system response regulator PilH
MKILVADDSPVLRAAVTKLLVAEGYDVVTAEDGVDAITRFYEEQPDLVLLDVQMPKLNGYVVCRLLKEDPIAASVPILILTIRTSAEDRYWGVKSGANGYLTKDALGEELMGAVQAALATSALRELTTGATAAPIATGEADVLTRVCEMLDRKLFEATVINEITSVAMKPIGMTESVDQILTSIGRLISFDAAAVVLVENAEMEMVSKRRLSDNDTARFRELAGEHLTRLSGNADLPPQSHVTVLFDETAADGDRGWETYHSVPLRSRGQLIGMLVFGMHMPGAMTDAMLATTRTVTPAIVSVLESARDFQSKLASEAREAFQGLA